MSAPAPDDLMRDMYSTCSSKGQLKHVLFKQCLAKRTYDTKEEAMEKGYELEPVLNRRFYVYPCRLCKKYHLTTRPQDDASPCWPEHATHKDALYIPFVKTDKGTMVPDLDSIIRIRHEPSLDRYRNKIITRVMRIPFTHIGYAAGDHVLNHCIHISPIYNKNLSSIMGSMGFLDVYPVYINKNGLIMKHLEKDLAGVLCLCESPYDYETWCINQYNETGYRPKLDLQTVCKKVRNMHKDLIRS